MSNNLNKHLTTIASLIDCKIGNSITGGNESELEQQAVITPCSVGI
ncbi:hypothetical protein [Pseudoalteromonas sp. SS15]